MVTQILIALDQVLNTFIDGGYADETISARCYRLRHIQLWDGRRKLIDSVALYVFKQDKHCYLSYLSEFERKQLPNEYRTPPLGGFFTSANKDSS